MISINVPETPPDRASIIRRMLPELDSHRVGLSAFSIIAELIVRQLDIVRITKQVGTMTGSMPKRKYWGSGPALSRVRARSSRTNTFFKAVIAALILAGAAPMSVSHVQSHFTANISQSQLVVVAVGSVITSDQGHSATGSRLFGGLEHHLCSSPCLEPFLTRSYCETAYLEGTRVRYPAYFDALRAKFEPDPLQKPPRLNISA